MQTIIALSLCLLTFAPAFAEPEQAKEISYQATKSEDQFQAMQQYCNQLERKIASFDTKLNALSTATDNSLQDLDRKVSGMQNQITVLHAKKADKEELQKTRDQAARIFKRLK